MFLRWQLALKCAALVLATALLLPALCPMALAALSTAPSNSCHDSQSSSDQQPPAGTEKCCSPAMGFPPIQSMVWMAVDNAPIDTLVNSFVSQAIRSAVSNTSANASPPGQTILRV